MFSCILTLICGYHWRSDVVAARIIGSGAVASLHADPSFVEQMNKAKAEFAQLKK